MRPMIDKGYVYQFRCFLPDCIQPPLFFLLALLLAVLILFCHQRCPPFSGETDAKSVRGAATGPSRLKRTRKT